MVVQKISSYRPFRDDHAGTKAGENRLLPRVEVPNEAMKGLASGIVKRQSIKTKATDVFHTRGSCIHCIAGLGFRGSTMIFRITNIAFRYPMENL